MVRVLKSTGILIIFQSLILRPKRKKHSKDEVPKGKGVNLEGTFLEVANTPKTSDVYLIGIALHNSPRRKRKRMNERKRAAMGSPWIEVQLKFSASVVRIETDSRRRISGPSFAVAKMTWAQRSGGKRDIWCAYLKLGFSNVRGRTTRNEKKRAKESSHNESVD